MRKIVIAAITSVAFISTSANAAPTDSQDVIVNATVQQECSVENPDDFDFGVLGINESPGPTALQITANEDLAEQNIWVSCNYAAQIKLTSTNGGLLNSSGAAVAANDDPDFTNLIEYRLRLVPTDSSFSAMTLQTNFGGAGVSTSITPAGAFHNEAVLDAEIKLSDNTGERPVAGTYTDTAVINLGPV